MMTHRVHRSPRGVTLIETLIYIFLFSLIMGGGIATGFWTFESTARTGRLAPVEQEADFVLRKLNWASVGSAVTSPAQGATGTALRFSRDGVVYTFTKSGDELTLSTDGGAPVPLTTGDVSLDGFMVEHLETSSGACPCAASTTLVISGTTYGPKLYYVR